MHSAGDIRFEREWTEYGEGYSAYLTPLYFHPAPPIIEIPGDCPRKVQEAIMKAFGLFWSSPGSCANMLRVAVERILDDQGIPSSKPNSAGISKPITLAERLKQFQQMKPSFDDTFKALRLVGNVGSHAGEAGDDELLDAFEIFEDALIEMYAPPGQRLSQLKAKLIASQGKYT